MLTAILLLFFCSTIVIGCDDNSFLYDTFPTDFKFSAATSAYQIEGAYNTSGKSLNIWDDFCAKGNCGGGDTGNVACDSYRLYERDVEMIKELGLKYYRFSLSWSRILPTNDPANPNQAGVDYYTKLIDKLIANDIVPQVTLYHWDLPLFLETEYGGWQNDSSVEWFSTYARFCFSTFKQVRFWITLNEPWVVAWLGYGNGVDAPGIKDAPGVKAYIAAHNLIKSHAHAYDIYKRELNLTGQVGITMNSDFYYPNNTADEADVNATRRAQVFQLGWFANAIFSKDGDYPKEMKEGIWAHSQERNLTESRLPKFTSEEVAFIKGKFDFFGLNHYSTQLVENHPNPKSNSYETDSDAHTFQPATWEGSGSSWLKVVPWGIRGVVNWIKAEYGDKVEIYITENGMSDNNGTTNDPWRSRYYTQYINELLKAIKCDNVSVKGYTAWALMDNMEWQVGYREKFGLYSVDFTNVNRTRTMKNSGKTYSKIVADNGFPIPPTTTTTTTTTPETKSSSTAPTTTNTAAADTTTTSGVARDSVAIVSLILTVLLTISVS